MVKMAASASSVNIISIIQQYLLSLSYTLKAAVNIYYNYTLKVMHTRYKNKTLNIHNTSISLYKPLQVSDSHNLAGPPYYIRPSRPQLIGGQARDMSRFGGSIMEKFLMVTVIKYTIISPFPLQTFLGYLHPFICRRQLKQNITIDSSIQPRK